MFRLIAYLEMEGIFFCGKTKNVLAIFSPSHSVQTAELCHVQDEPGDVVVIAVVFLLVVVEAAQLLLLLPAKINSFPKKNTQKLLFFRNPH